MNTKVKIAYTGVALAGILSGYFIGKKYGVFKGILGGIAVIAIIAISFIVFFSFNIKGD